MEKGNYNAAIGVYLIKVKLLPESWDAYEELAEAYMKNHQYNFALLNYEKSIELNPDNDECKKQIERLTKNKK